MEYTDRYVDESEVINVVFSYEVDGHTYYGDSYDSYVLDEVGDLVHIEYVVEHPHAARLVGNDVSTNATQVILVMLAILIVGLVILLRRRVKYRLLRQILKNAAIVKSDLSDRIETSTRVNNQPVYKLVFAYTVNNQRYTVAYSTHLTNQFGNSAFVVYHAEKPKLGALVKELPSGIRAALLKATTP